MQFLNVVLGVFLSSSFSWVAAVPQLNNDAIVAMSEGVFYARNFMDGLAEEHRARVKRDCGYPVDINNDGDINNPENCDSNDVWHCNACVDSCANYGNEPCINAACGAGQVG
ncbi:hypothetical protein C8R43DRAFT_1128257 [Mycena crocata]|nr:hypothetical protein C8R43DRAFT_1128257 [Mycena crocata]